MEIDRAGDAADQEDGLFEDPRDTTKRNMHATSARRTNGVEMRCETRPPCREKRHLNILVPLSVARVALRAPVLTMRVQLAAARSSVLGGWASTTSLTSPQAALISFQWRRRLSSGALPSR